MPQIRAQRFQIFLVVSLFFLNSLAPSVHADPRELLFPFYSAVSSCESGSVASGSIPGSKNVYILGDSIAAGLQQDGLEARLSQHTGGTVKINHDSGRSITDKGTDVKQSALEAVEADKDIIKSAGYIIVVLGTNPTDNPFDRNMDTMLEKLRVHAPNALYFWVDIGATRANSVGTWNERNKIIYEKSGTKNFTVISRYKAIFGSDKDPLNIEPDAEIPGSTDNVHGGYPKLSETILNSLKGGTDAVVVGQNCSCGSTLLAGKDNAEKIWNFFTSKGLAPFQTAGFMGNLQAESGFDPGIEERSTGIGFGIAQWSFGRRTNLENAAKEKGVPVSDLSFQLDFLWGELEGSYKNSVLEPLKASTNIEDATWIVLDEFESPKDPEGKRAMRTSFANDLLQRLGGGSASSSTSGGGGCSSGSAVGQKIVEIALQEVGNAESPDGSNSGPDINKYFTDQGRSPGTTWCEVFTQWVIFKATGTKIGRYGAKNTGLWFKENKNFWGWQEKIRPAPGDILVKGRDGNNTALEALGPGHIGIVIEVNGFSIKTVEGNSSDAVSQREYADYREIDSFIGFGRFSEPGTVSEDPSFDPLAGYSGNQSGPSKED